LLCGVFATASIGGTAGLLEGHPQQVPIQLYGIAVTLVWSAGVTYALLRLVGIFCRSGFPGSRRWKASISRSTARPCSSGPTKLPFCCVCRGQNYVRTLA